MSAVPQTEPLSTEEMHVARQDPARLAAVRASGLLDSGSEEVFDRLSRLAVRVLGVPAAFISVVDSERDFYKSSCGFGEPLASAREWTGVTFCHQTIGASAPVVIGDTSSHPAYNRVPTVRSLEVAAYLGVPLRIDGQAIGALCAIDVKPREWNDDDIEVLSELTAAAQREIELRAAVRSQQGLTFELAATNELLRAAAQQLEDRVMIAEELRAVAEEAHARSVEAELRFRAVEDASPDGSILLRPIRDHGDEITDFEFVYANPVTAHVLGPPGKDLPGTTLLERFPKLDAGGFLSAYRDVMESGESWVENTRYDRDGITVALKVTAVRAGNLVHVRFTDMRAQVEEKEVAAAAFAEARIREAAAEAANRAKSDFLATMSHELRTPLNAIGGHAQLIELGVYGSITDDQRLALSRIQGAQQRLLALINDILSFSRMEAGRLEYQITDVDVRAIVAETIPLVETQVASRGLSLRVDLPQEGLLVRADGEKLVQVLLNLLSNAIKFTEASAPAPQIRISVVKRAGGDPGGMLYLRVSDSGRGIAADKQKGIFDPFTQVHATDASVQHGTGLGLAISRDLARGMGGDVRVRSEPGVGSAFTVSLVRAAP